MGAKGRIIVFGDDWGRHPSSSQHLILELLRFYEVVWVNSVGMRAPRLSLSDFGRIWTKLIDGVFGAKDKSTELNSLTTIDPLVIPFHKFFLFKIINRIILKIQLRKYSQTELELILWVSNPIAEYLKTAAKFDRLIYYCGDDFGSFQGVDVKQINMAESQLYQNAQLIIFASKDLQDKREIECTGRVLLVPHGVAESRFATSEIKPKLLEGRSGPIIGYVGIFEEWIDLDLLIYLIQENPELNFCLIGDTKGHTKSLKKFSNVILTGQLRHAVLPNYLQYFDVGLLLYRDLPMTRAITPLKLYEYYAQGIPVVSTLQFKGVSGFEHVRIADSKEDFAEHMKHALEDATYTKLKLIDIARENSWSMRAQVIKEQLDFLRKN